MFNNNSNIRNELNINAVSGMLIKNHPNSFFNRFHMNSQRAKELFEPHPTYDGRPSIVLQVLILADKEFLAEIVYEKDYELKVEV